MGKKAPTRSKNPNKQQSQFVQLSLNFPEITSPATETTQPGKAHTPARAQPIASNNNSTLLFPSICPRIFRLERKETEIEND